MFQALKIRKSKLPVREQLKFLYQNKKKMKRQRRQNTPRWLKQFDKTFNDSYFSKDFIINASILSNRKNKQIKLKKLTFSQIQISQSRSSSLMQKIKKKFPLKTKEQSEKTKKLELNKKQTIKSEPIEKRNGDLSSIQSYDFNQTKLSQVLALSQKSKSIESEMGSKQMTNIFLDINETKSCDIQKMQEVIIKNIRQTDQQQGYFDLSPERRRSINYNSVKVYGSRNKSQDGKVFNSGFKFKQSMKSIEQQVQQQKKSQQSKTSKRSLQQVQTDNILNQLNQQKSFENQRQIHIQNQCLNSQISNCEQIKPPNQTNISSQIRSIISLIDKIQGESMTQRQMSFSLTQITIKAFQQNFRQRQNSPHLIKTADLEIKSQRSQKRNRSRNKKKNSDWN